MAGRDDYIRISQEALLQEFAHDPLEQVHFRPFVLRSMMIACGFKTLYKQVTGKDCDLETDLKGLEHVAFSSITRHEIKQYCEGRTLHPEIRELLHVTSAFKTAKRRTPQEYELDLDAQNQHYELEMQKLTAQFKTEKAAFVAGVSATGKPVAILAAAVAENTKKTDALAGMKGRIDANLLYTNQVGLDIITLRQVKQELEIKLTDQLKALTDLAANTTNPMEPTTRALLEEIKAAGGGIASAGSGNEAALAAEVATLKGEKSTWEAERLDLMNEKMEWVEFYTKVHAPLLKAMSSQLSAAVEKDPVDHKLKRSASASAELAHIKGVDPATICPTLCANHGSLVNEFKSACTRLDDFNAECHRISVKINKLQGPWPSSTQNIRDLLEMGRNMSVLQYLTLPLASCCAPLDVLDLMLTKHHAYLTKRSSQKINWDICKTPTSAAASGAPVASTWAGFTGMVFHIEGGSIRPCHPDLCHPLMYSTVLSHLNMVLAEAKSSAAMAMATGVLEMCNTLDPTRYNEHFKITVGTFSRLLESKLISVIGAKTEEDAPLLAFLLQMVSLTGRDDLYLTYNSSSGLEVIRPTDFSDLRDAVCCMVLNISKFGKKLNNVPNTDTTSVDDAYKQLFIAFGFTAEQMKRACTDA